MENVGIYLFALIVLVWPAVTYFLAANINTSQWSTVDEINYGSVMGTTNPSTTVAPTPNYAKSSNLLPTSEPHIRTK